MVAKTYDEAKAFDLAEQYEVLRDGSDDEKECLAAAKFETHSGIYHHAMRCSDNAPGGAEPRYFKDSGARPSSKIGSR